MGNIRKKVAPAALGPVVLGLLLLWSEKHTKQRDHPDELIHSCPQAICFFRLVLLEQPLAAIPKIAFHLSTLAPTDCWRKPLELWN
jgi:hypothetical protein